MKNTCKICGKKFNASRKINVLCSSKCKKISHKRNYKKYRQSEKGKKTIRLCMNNFHKERIKERKKAGVCVECERKLPSNYIKLRCKKCLEKQNIIAKKIKKHRKNDGVCITCGSKEICNLTNIHTKKKNKELFCEKCYLKKISRNLWGTVKKWILLKDLFNKQDSKCAYTGRKLVIGKNASIDHKICKAKNGNNDIENLQWVEWKVNLMKRDLDQKEFLQLINLISGRIPQ